MQTVTLEERIIDLEREVAVLTKRIQDLEHNAAISYQRVIFPATPSTKSPDLYPYVVTCRESWK